MIQKFLLTLAFLTLFVNQYGQLKDNPKKKEKEVTITRILFVFDASYSMYGKWEKDIKIDAAKKTMISFVDSLQKVPNVMMALRIYGHQSPVKPQDCNDTRLEVAFGPNAPSLMRQKLRNLTPKGTTPIAKSLQSAAKDFPPCNNCRNVIILITDGVEACDGDPCAVSQDLQKQGIILKPFIIGIGIDEEFKKSFECLGQYLDAKNEASFNDMLGVVINQIMNSTTVQVNLMDEQAKPSISNVNMTFYDELSGKAKYNLVHTMNHRGVPDTLNIDHLLNYHLVVNTIPPVEKKNIVLQPGIHNIVAIDCPQGTLHIKTPGTTLYNDVSCIVRKAGKMETLYYHKVELTERLLTGNYDIEIPIIPRIYIEGVNIKQNHTTVVEIPRPGIANFLSSYSGYGSLYIVRNNMQEWVYNLKPQEKNESVILQPGSYIVVFRSQGAKESIYTLSRRFEIASGTTLAIELD